MAETSEGFQKWGSTALSGYWRQGVAEVRAALPLADSPIAQPSDYGMPGVATPGEVSAARSEDSPALDEESTLNSRLQAAEASRDDRGRDDQEKGLDRD
jgi:hypothetical protein